jgi:hypothetical protein
MEYTPARHPALRGPESAVGKTFERALDNVPISLILNLIIRRKALSGRGRSSTAKAEFRDRWRKTNGFLGQDDQPPFNGPTGKE